MVAAPSPSQTRRARSPGRGTARDDVHLRHRLGRKVLRPRRRGRLLHVRGVHAERDAHPQARGAAGPAVRQGTAKRATTREDGAPPRGGGGGGGCRCRGREDGRGRDRDRRAVARLPRDAASGGGGGRDGRGVDPRAAPPAGSADAILAPAATAGDASSPTPSPGAPPKRANASVATHPRDRGALLPNLARVVVGVAAPFFLSAARDFLRARRKNATIRRAAAATADERAALLADARRVLTRLRRDDASPSDAPSRAANADVIERLLLELERSSLRAAAATRRSSGLDASATPRASAAAAGAHAPAPLSLRTKAALERVRRIGGTPEQLAGRGKDANGSSRSPLSLEELDRVVGFQAKELRYLRLALADAERRGWTLSRAADAAEDKNASLSLPVGDEEEEAFAFESKEAAAEAAAPSDAASEGSPPPAASPLVAVSLTVTPPPGVEASGDSPSERPSSPTPVRVSLLAVAPEDRHNTRALDRAVAVERTRTFRTPETTDAWLRRAAKRFAPSVSPEDAAAPSI